MAVLAWTAVGERPRELAAPLGGEPVTLYAFSIVQPAAIPLRYAIDAVRTIAYLGLRRPRGLVVVNPPIFPGMLAAAYARATGVPFVLDSHPSSFGLAGDALSRRMLPAHAWAARRARVTLVSAPALADIVRRWGARAELIGEAPPAWSVTPARTPGPRPRILFPGIFSGDEPVADVLAAARAVPQVDVVVTGDLRKCPPLLRQSAPENVLFVGFLSPDGYVRALGDADAVLSLTTEPTSVMRTAHEAVWAGRPLIVTDRPDLRELFASAIHVDNDAGSIADGLREVVARHGELVALAPAQRRVQEERWEEQLATLRSCLDLPAVAPARRAQDEASI